MKVIFAKHIGFCFGVKRAVALAEDSLKKDKKPIWFLGELVHNEKVLEKFRKRKVKFISHPRKATSGTLIIQAHGFHPFVKKEILTRDATCPLVKRAQLLAKSFCKKGYQVIIVGDKKHSETKGIKGYAGKGAIVIENENEARRLPGFKKIGVVIQTTQRIDNFRKVLKVLRKKAKEIRWFDTICPEVNARQGELAKILKKCDAVLVIGSRLSANTKRLVETAKDMKRKIFWAVSLTELRNKRIKGVSVLGVVSGTSAPDWEIRKIKKWLLGLKQ